MTADLSGDRDGPAVGVVLSAGGVASTVAAYWLARHRTRIVLVSCDLGGQARGVLAAATVAAGLGCEHRVADLSAFAAALTRDSGRVPGGSLGRLANAVPLMIELGHVVAAHRGAEVVVLGVHADDALLVDPAVLDRGRVETPLAGMSVAEVLRLGVRLRVPLHQTRSCQRDQATHCGQCSGCRYRRGAFTASAVSDPTLYQHDG